MQTRICFTLCALFVVGLLYGYVLWNDLSAQSVFRISARVNEALVDALDKIADNERLEMGVYAVRDLKTNVLDECQLYEFVRFNPNASGMVILKGSFITAAQVKNGDTVVMLSEQAAMHYSPEMDCIDTFIEIDGVPRKVVGIYKANEPLGFLTRTEKVSAILPFVSNNPDRTKPCRLFVWIRTENGALFTHNTVRKELKVLHEDNDTGSYQSFDLNKMAEENKQAIRFFILMLLLLLCYFRRSAWLIWAMWFAHCATRLVINADKVPTQFLDPEAWLTKLEAYVISSNISEDVPMHTYLLAVRLEQMCMMFGTMALLMLLLGIVMRTKNVEIME